MIPGTERTQTHLFAISGNGPKFIYDLLKFINFSCKTEMFTNKSDEKDAS